MQARSEEKVKSSPNSFHPRLLANIVRPTTVRMEAMIKIILFALDLNNLQANETIKPSAAPKTSEAIISISGTTITLINEIDVALASDLEIENKTEKAIKATASSKATTGIRVSTSGPLALYCLITISVAAGAVAQATAPKVKMIDIGKVSFRKM